MVPAATGVLAAARTGERPPGRFWLACFIGFTAVFVFALTQSGGRLQASDLWLAAAVLSCAVGYVEGAKVSRAIGAIPALCWAMILLAPAAATALAATVYLNTASRVAVPAIPGALELLAGGGGLSGGSRRNRDFVERFATFAEDVPDERRALLCDAMTSGGLLVAVEPGRAAEMEAALREAAPATRRIGELRAGEPGAIMVN